MKVDILNQRQIAVLLSQEDIEEFEIDLCNLNEGSPDTAELLWSILNLAGEKVNLKAPPQGEIYIDIEMQDSGNCQMTFTLPSTSFGKRSVIKKGLVAPMLFQFDSIDTLLSLRAVLQKEHMLPVKSDLFCAGEYYRLLIYQPYKIGSYIPLLLQFAPSLKGSVTIAFTKEHWHCVSQRTALEQLLVNNK